MTTELTQHQWEHQLEATTGERLKLVQSIEVNTKHYVEILSRAIDKQMPRPSQDITYVLY